MAAREQIERLRVALSVLSGQVADLLEFFLGTLDLENAEESKDALLEFIPALTTEYGGVAAEVAAAWFEETVSMGGRSAIPAPVVDTGAVEAKVRYVADHLWTPTPGTVAKPLQVAVDKYVKQPYRDTVELNAKRVGVRFARVPQGPKTCAFCLVMASRDAVYLTAHSAGDTGRGLGDRFHGRCDCAVVPIETDEDYPDGYLPDRYYEMYRDAVDRAANDPAAQAFLATLDPDEKHKQLKATVFAMRREFPELVNDGVHVHAP